MNQVENNVIVTEDEIQNKIIQILNENSIIELSGLLTELDISDKSLVVKVLRTFR